MGEHVCGVSSERMRTDPWPTRLEDLLANSANTASPPPLDAYPPRSNGVQDKFGRMLPAVDTTAASMLSYLAPMPWD